MINPLAVATGGWLAKAPLPIASSGYLFLAGDVEPPDPTLKRYAADPGGWEAETPWKDTFLGRQILREDDEILAIIMAATRVIQ